MKIKNIVVFDAHLVRFADSDLIELMCENIHMEKIKLRDRDYFSQTGLWLDVWKFYSHIKGFHKYLPSEIIFENKIKILGVIIVLNIDLYHTALTAGGKEVVHKDFTSDELNSVVWTKKHSLPFSFILLDEKKHLVDYYYQEVFDLYQLDGNDLLLKADLSTPETVFDALLKTTQHFDDYENNIRSSLTADD
jgi:hypothetical protein